MNKYGCLSNQTDQSQRENLRNKPKQSKTRDQTATTCLNRPTNQQIAAHTPHLIIQIQLRTHTPLTILNWPIVLRKLEISSHDGKIK